MRRKSKVFVSIALSISVGFAIYYGYESVLAGSNFRVTGIAMFVGVSGFLVSVLVSGLYLLWSQDEPKGSWSIALLSLSTISLLIAFVAAIIRESELSLPWDLHRVVGSVIMNGLVLGLLLGSGFLLWSAICERET